LSLRVRRHWIGAMLVHSPFDPGTHTMVGRGGWRWGAGAGQFRSSTNAQRRMLRATGGRTGRPVGIAAMRFMKKVLLAD
jgi:hypothetical protein